MTFEWLKNWLPGTAIANGDRREPAPDLDETARLIEYGNPADPAILEKIAAGLGQTEPDKF